LAGKKAAIYYNEESSILQVLSYKVWIF